MWNPPLHISQPFKEFHILFYGSKKSMWSSFFNQYRLINQCFTYLTFKVKCSGREHVM